MISSIKPYTFSIKSYCRKILHRAANRIPNAQISNQTALKSIKWIGEHVSSPQNRLILGASALLSQPFIDLNNKNVDKETRKNSAARTIAKIIVGTATGFYVRYYTIKAVEAMTKIPNNNRNLKWWETLLTPDRSRVAYKSLKKYKLAVGSIAAVGVMLFTNFLIDAPLTKILTNAIIDKINKKTNKKTQKDVIYYPQVHMSDLLSHRTEKEVGNV